MARRDLRHVSSPLRGVPCRRRATLAPGRSRVTRWIRAGRPVGSNLRGHDPLQALAGALRLSAMPDTQLALAIQARASGSDHHAVATVRRNLASPACWRPLTYHRAHRMLTRSCGSRWLQRLVSLATTGAHPNA